MNKTFRFSYRPVEPTQKKWVCDGIVQKHISEWLHGEGLKNTFIDLEHFPDRGSWGIHWIAYDNEIPFAYLITSKLEQLSPDDKEAITLDLFICNLDYLGKGLAVQMIHEFLLSQYSYVDRVLIDPEIANQRAVHVYEKAGFQIIEEFIAEWHPVPHYRMQLDMEHLRGSKVIQE
ncbi:GNAT family N-acetyltransferase [Legionella quateirensis]|uniref:Aminoglycoside N(6')acetyltransferase n=1 Tax=Legionella quateirensis TaxID=45072 RepID=A0A378KT12_9GAMM|nr:GNAT family N-acetyltransferase [Legionella quateirensis]KTD51297.1 aminoglycoside N(6')acetyltransferase [Legionella quateirensis]STY17456.1 Aminoglycoside N(6')acetyltransferase [Legionella quateirensis]